MASSWGLSWLRSWGDSWGRTAVDEKPKGSPGGIDASAKSKRFGFAAAKKNKRREEEELILLMSF